MNIPNLPTDNLYKFAALFGLVLIVFSSFMFNQSINTAYRFEDNLNANNAIYELDSLNKSDSIHIAKVKIELRKDFKQNNRIAKKIPLLFGLYKFLLILGLISALIGFYRWYHKTQKLNDEILKNEAEKIRNGKALLIHKLQFEKEFEVYQKLWPSLIKLKIATQDLRPIFEFGKKEPNNIDELKKNGDTFNKCMLDCLKIFQENKPFYSQEVYDKTNSVLLISQKEVSEWTTSLGRGLEFEDYKKAERNVNDYMNLINEISDKIRERIGVLEIKN